MSKRFGVRGIPILLDMLTLLDIALSIAMLLGCIWKTSLPDTQFRCASVGLYGLSLVVCLWTILTPDPPRLRREKGCARESSTQWLGMVILLIFGGFGLYDCFPLQSGVHSLFKDVYHAVSSLSFMNLLGLCLTAAYARLLIRWNEDGVLLRTCFGRVYHFGWEEITAHHKSSAKAREYISIGKRRFSLPEMPVWQRSEFWQAGALCRRAHGLPAVPW